MGSDNFYHDEPLFGLDIGHSSIKVMQVEAHKDRQPQVLGYGSVKFPPNSIINGVIANYDNLSKSLYELFKDRLSGSIYTHRVACSLPTAHTFSRLMKLPEMADEDIAEAIKLEAEQYIPMPIGNLYIDYDISSRSPSGIELLMVAAPKAIVDSYIKLLENLNLQPVAIEPSMNAVSRLFGVADANSKAPAILIDFGSAAIDIAVFDKTIFVNSTLSGGGQAMTNLISKSLKIDSQAAEDLKAKYGIAEGQKQQIMSAIRPMLEELVREIRKMVRYYNDRVSGSHREIVHIITSGGGAQMPGINEYLSSELQLPAKVLEPWQRLDFGALPKPPQEQQAEYLTVAGNAILNPEAIFA